MDLDKLNAARGENTEQMLKIAENCNFTDEEKEEFYKAVEKHTGHTWIYKACFANSQDFFLRDDLKGLVYEEGYCNSSNAGPIQHAWLRWNGKILDLTLGFDGKVEEKDYRPYFSKGGDEGRDVVRRQIKEHKEWNTLTHIPSALSDEDFERVKSVFKDVYENNSFGCFSD